jgi:hypothetical protein
MVSSGHQQQRAKQGSENVFQGKSAVFLKLGRGANQYNVEK